MQAPIRYAVLLLLASAPAGCGGEETAPPPPSPRPVTTIALREIDPVRPLQVTGSVESWKEQEIALDVPGRVEYIVEPGTLLRGRWIEDGEVRVAGDVLARIDPRPYEIRRATAAANLEVARQQLATAVLELEKVLPTNLRAAAAERERAQAEHERNTAARARNAIAEVDLLRSTADRDVTQAKYEQAAAAFDTQMAAIESLRASARAAEAQLEDAEYDLARTTLHAPFAGEVSAVHVEAGGYVQTGQAVAHLVMMTPIQVAVAVSAQTAARLDRNDLVRVYPPDGKALLARVYEKSTTADPRTRTFRVSILVPNERVVPRLEPDDALLALPRIPEFMYLEPAMLDAGAAFYFVEERRSLRTDGDDWFVWADPAWKMGVRSDAPTHVTLRRYRVVPGERRLNFQGLYLVRELADVGELERGTLVALDVPDDFEEGGRALVARSEWRLRPGQLVQVLLDVHAPRPGLYLPMSAIRPADERRGSVFVVDAGRAREARVELGESVGELIGVTPAGPADAALLGPGAQVIADSIHFLLDGEPVRVVRELELEP